MNNYKDPLIYDSALVRGARYALENPIAEIPIVASDEFIRGMNNASKVMGDLIFRESIKNLKDSIKNQELNSGQDITGIF